MDRLLNIFKQIRSKIAFYPSLIALGGLALAFLLIYLESINISSFLIDVAPFLVIDDTDTAKTILSTLIGGLISLTVLCLAAFIYFIHHISQAIQVGNILTAIHSRTKKELAIIIENQEDKNQDFPSTDHWEKHKITQRGYFYGILKDDLIELCKENNLKAMISLHKGQFIIDGTVGFLTEKPVEDELKKKIEKTLLFSHTELIGENFIYGFRQISEIGIKAMSPGINDPGTALNTIDYLSSLFIDLLLKKDHEFLTDKNGVNWVSLNCPEFSVILFNVMATYRQYCKHDITVMRKLMHKLKTLKLHVVHSDQLKIIEAEIDQLRQDAITSITNKRDLEQLEADYFSWS